MNIEKQIDEALDSVLRASGSRLDLYTMPKPLQEMRDAMREVLTKAYVRGSNDCHNAFMGRAK